SHQSLCFRRSDPFLPLRASLFCMNFDRPFLLTLPRILAVSAIVAILAASPLPAQPAPTPSPKDARIGALIQSIGQAKHISQATLSPDGKTVAWSLEAR